MSWIGVWRHAEGSRPFGGRSGDVPGVTIVRIILLLALLSLTACVPSNSVLVSQGKERSGTREDAESMPAGSIYPVTRTRLKVVTFNIRWQGCYNGEYIDSGFVRRKPLVLEVLRESGAGIIGLQEASIEQRAQIAAELTGFGMYPSPAEAGDEGILYRLDRFVLTDSGHEFVRRMPEVPGTNIGVRDFVWVNLQDRFSGKRFYVLNLHLDHRSSVRGRQLDGVRVGEWMRKRRSDDPVVLVGDFNGNPADPRYLYLTGQRSYPGDDGIIVGTPMPMLDTFREANPDAQFTGTINSGFKGVKNRTQIDYVLVPAGSRVLDSRIIYYHKDGAYPSDHFPLESEFELQ